MELSIPDKFNSVWNIFLKPILILYRHNKRNNVFLLIISSYENPKYNNIGLV